MCSVTGCSRPVISRKVLGQDRGLYRLGGGGGECTQLGGACCQCARISALICSLRGLETLSRTSALNLRRSGCRCRSGQTRGLMLYRSPSARSCSRSTALCSARWTPTMQPTQPSRLRRKEPQWPHRRWVSLISQDRSGPWPSIVQVLTVTCVQQQIDARFKCGNTRVHKHTDRREA